jgi:hypothetical protein
MKGNVWPTGKSALYGLTAFSVMMIATAVAQAAPQDGPGSEQYLGNQRIFSWEKMNGAAVVEVGVTIPFAIFESPPPQTGSGPAGAIAVIGFSKTVQETTCLNHFELNWEKHGHEPRVFMHPHFDFHFYGVSPDTVMAVSLPDPSPPGAALLPSGYVYPGAEFTVPQMGVHAVRPADMEKPFTDVLIFGYYGGQMTFIEPMVTQAKLMQQQSIAYVLPVPPSMGKITRYPTKFRLVYDRQANACHLIFSDFITTAV